jgi:hypothetical protein
MKMIKSIRKVFLFFLTVSLITTIGCNPNDQTDSLLITAVSPDWVLSGTPLTLMVTGEGFNGNSVIVVNGSAVETVFVSGEELQGILEASHTTLAPDIESDTVYVQVEQPSASSSNEINRSNVVYLEIRHIPRCGEPALINSGAGVNDRGGIRLLAADSPRLYVYWWDRESAASRAQQQKRAAAVPGGETGSPEYGYKLMVSTDNGVTWSDAKNAPQLSSLSVFGGILYGWKTGSKDDPNVLFYQSEDMGDTWSQVGTFSPPPFETNRYICTGVTHDAGGNLLILHAIKNSSDWMILRTYGSTDHGANWTTISEHSFDISYMYTSVWPTVLLTNNVGGVLFEFAYQYGRYAMGAGLISRDGGLTYEEISSSSSVDGGQFILTDQEELIMLQTVMYLPYMYKPYFNIRFNMGTVSGTWYDLDELIPEYDGGGRGIMRVENGNLYIQRGNRMTGSYDNGETWTPSSVFLDSFPAGGDIIVRSGGDNTFYVLVLDEAYDLYFCSSLN